MKTDKLFKVKDLNKKRKEYMKFTIKIKIIRKINIPKKVNKGAYFSKNIYNKFKFRK